MPKRKARATDTVGRPTSKAAQAIHDAKGESPQNYALNKEIAERAAQHVGDFISRVDHTRSSLIDKLVVLYALWNGDSVADYFPAARHVHVPEPYKAVEGFVPRIASILIEQPGWFRVVGKDEAGKKNSEFITKLVRSQLKADDFNLKARDFFRGSGIYGYLPGKVYWKKRRKKVKYNKVTSEPDENGGEKLEVERGVETELNQDGPTLETTDILDFYVDNRYRDEQDSPGVAWRVEKFEPEVRANSLGYANIKELLSSKPIDRSSIVQGPLGSTGNLAGWKDLRNRKDGLGVEINSDKQGAKRFEFIEFWGLFNPNYDPKSDSWSGEDKEFKIVLGRRAGPAKNQSGWTCVQCCENPYFHQRRPSVVAHFTRRPHVFPSVGLIEPILTLSMELDDSRQMALAARALAAKPVVVANDQADLYGQNLVLDPGSVIRTRGGVKDSVAALFIPDRSDAAWRAEDMIKSDIRETTGIISTYQGSADSSSETATSVVNRTREANKRITEVAKNIANGFLIPVLEMFHAMNQQFLTKERMIELLGEDGAHVDIEKVSPADVAGQVGFEITALPEIEIAGLKSRMLDNFLGRALEVETVRPGTSRIDKLLQSIYIAEFGTGKLDEAFVNPEAPLTYRTPQEEHQVLGMGHSLDVQQGENYMSHLREHRRFAGTPYFRTEWDEDAKRRMMAHIETTRARMQQEAMESEPRTPMEMEAQQAQMMGPGQQAAQPGQMPQLPQPPQSPQQGPPQPGPQSLGPTTPTGQVRSAAAANSPRTPTGGDE